MKFPSILADSWLILAKIMHDCICPNKSNMLLNLDHTRLCILVLVNYFCSVAPCVKVFQLLLGEVNDCTDWRVSKF